MVKSFSCTVLTNRHQVFDTYTKFTWHINSRLNTENIARFKRHCISLNHKRRFMNGDTNSVSHSIEEELTVSGVNNHLAGSSVNVLASSSGAYRSFPSRLRPADNFVNFFLFLCRLTNKKSASGIGAVALITSAKVKNNNVIIRSYIKNRYNGN